MKIFEIHRSLTYDYEHFISFQGMAIHGKCYFLSDMNVALLMHTRSFYVLHFLYIFVYSSVNNIQF